MANYDGPGMPCSHDPCWCTPSAPPVAPSGETTPEVEARLNAIATRINGCHELVARRDGMEAITDQTRRDIAWLVETVRVGFDAFARNAQGLEDDIETVRYTIGHLKATGHDEQTYIWRDLSRVLRNLETVRKRSGHAPKGDG